MLGMVCFGHTRLIIRMNHHTRSLFYALHLQRATTRRDLLARIYRVAAGATSDFCNNDGREAASFDRCHNPRLT